MDSASIELPGSELDAILMEDGCLRICFSRVIIIKTMTGSSEKTRWWQTGELVMEGAELEGNPPQGHLVCVGGGHRGQYLHISRHDPLAPGEQGMCRM